MELPISEQRDQLEYWLNFLQSSLDTTQSKWMVVVVGLRHDTKSAQVVDLEILKSNWPNLNFFEENFQVSSYTRFGIAELKKKLAEKCTKLLDDNAMQIPVSYRRVFDALQTTSLPPIVTHNVVYKSLAAGGLKVDATTLRALNYLHDIGMV